MDRKKLIKRLIYLIFFIFAANFLANEFYWYYSVWYLDMLMHFLGGFWIGLAAIWFSSQSFRPSTEFKTLTGKWIFKILFFVLLVGLGWEIFEILVNDVIAQNPLNYLDTASDVFLDLSGGTFAILYFLERIMLQSKDGHLGDSLPGRS